MSYIVEYISTTGNRIPVLHKVFETVEAATEFGRKGTTSGLYKSFKIINEATASSRYDLYHKDFSTAMKHAYNFAKSKYDITIDPEEIDNKVATGPSKPGTGKTNSYRLVGDNGAVQVQVYNTGKSYELNMYKESVEEETLDESLSPTQLEKLKKQYATTGDRISTDAAMKMNAMIKKFDKPALISLYKANIKWLSTSAMTQLISKHGMKAADLKAVSEEVESITELTAEEKRLINTMYDKKGNLTDVGKKVMDHGKKNRFPHNTSATQGKMMSGKSTMYSEDTQIDEAKLSQQQRDRLDDLIFNVMITGNIEYDGKDNPTRHLKTIEKEFGAKVAKQVEAGMDIKNWGRDNRSSGIDRLALRKKSRVSASGKMNKQDAVALGKRIMQDKSFGGLTKKVKLPEDTQIDEEVGQDNYEKTKQKTMKTFPNVKHFTKSGHPDWKKHGITDIPSKESVDEAYISNTADAVNVLANLRKIGKSIERGQQPGHEGNLANMYATDVWDVYQWIESKTKGFNNIDKNFQDAVDAMMDLRGEAKKLETSPGSGSNARFGNQIVNTLYPVMQYIERDITDRVEEEVSPDDIKKALSNVKSQPKEKVSLKKAPWEIKEDISQDAQHMERDHEVQMARSDLYKTANYAIKLHAILKGISEEQGLDGWMQAKITKAADYISSVYHALEYDQIERSQSEPIIPEDIAESKAKPKNNALIMAKNLDKINAAIDKKKEVTEASRIVIGESLNEVAIVMPAVMWVLRWTIARGAWPLLKWVLKRYSGKITLGAVAVAAIDQGWSWVENHLGAEMTNLLIENKFEIGMAIALIFGAAMVKRFVESQGDKLWNKMFTTETTTSGGIATSMGGGNGFVNGGPGTLSRAGTASNKRKRKT